MTESYISANEGSSKCNVWYRPVHSADGRFKLLHDVYQSKTYKKHEPHKPSGVGARDTLHSLVVSACTPPLGDCASFGFQLESPSRPKAALAAALAGCVVKSLLDHTAWHTL